MYFIGTDYDKYSFEEPSPLHPSGGTFRRTNPQTYLKHLIQATLKQLLPDLTGSHNTLVTTHLEDKTHEVVSLIVMGSQNGVLGIDDLLTGTICS